MFYECHENERADDPNSKHSSSAIPIKPDPDAFAAQESSNCTPCQPSIVFITKDSKITHELADIVALLDKAGILQDRVLCLNLLALLAEHVGYEYAGDTGAVTIAELMLISARLIKLTENLDQEEGG